MEPKCSIVCPSKAQGQAIRSDMDAWPDPAAPWVSLGFCDVAHQGDKVYTLAEMSGYQTRIGIPLWSMINGLICLDLLDMDESLPLARYPNRYNQCIIHQWKPESYR